MKSTGKKGCQHSCGPSDFYATGKCHVNGCYIFQPWNLNDIVKQGIRKNYDHGWAIVQQVRSFRINGIAGCTYIVHRSFGSAPAVGVSFTEFTYPAINQLSLFS